MFIAANGDVMPSGFLPVSAGNIRDAEAIDIYRHASVFRALRAPETFHGRCGVCGFRMVCGGSRARAYAVTEDCSDGSGARAPGTIWSTWRSRPTCISTTASLRASPAC
jgi:radical SAM protein with 4Fe4S-binding SPASM domain